MRLKRLDVRGFKTFASPVFLEFVSPITAIVGPNGSGKSNLADAVRWVLGEQSLRMVRCKRTEDVIFAGGHGRAQLGMAEVSLTLDNADGWLSLPQAEVCITRRAYRSGDNEYLINGSKVRLRDLTDLVLKANVGPDGYAVIGQGMVDLALSMRPEERRFLFEEAADVKRHYLKIREANDKLTATENNMRRVADLVAEIAPRLASLERQAERARKHAILSGELRGLLLRWYRHQWQRAKVQLAQAETEEARVSTAYQAVESEGEALAQAIAAASERRAAVAAQLAELATETAGLASKMEAAQLELAVGRERAKALAGRRAEAERRQQEMAESRQRLGQQIVELRAQAGHREQERERLRVEVARLETAATEAQRRRERHAAEISAAEKEAERLTEAWAQTRAATARQAEQRTTAEREIEQQQRSLEGAGRRLAEAEREIAAGEARLQGLTAELQKTSEAFTTREHAAAGLEAELGATEQRVEQVRREHSTLQARLTMLQHWHNDLSGYHSGVRSVLQAARGGKGGQLGGIVGVVASLLHVPKELETAVEVALGGRLQDVVVERWQDAEAAIDHLKRTRGGRATFLPLDTLRQSNVQNPTSGPGILGVGSELVTYNPAHTVVARHLLGRTLVVVDLAVARRALDRCPAGWQIVTLAGEVVRASGAVTGGTLNQQQSGLLGQERELRDLPRRLEELAAKLAEGERAAHERRLALRGMRDELVRLGRQEREQMTACQRAEADLAARARETDRLRREHQRLADSVRNVEQARAAAVQRAEKMAAELASLAEAREQARERAETARAALAALDAADGDAVRGLAEARAALATAQREHERLTRETAEHEAELARLTRAAGLAQQERESLEQAAAELERSLAVFEKRVAGLNAERARYTERETGLKTELAGVEREGAQLAESQQTLHKRQTALSAAQAATAANVQRLRAEIGTLSERIGTDLGLEGEEDHRQLRLQWDTAEHEEETDPLPPEALRRRIDQLRGQLRSLSAVNPEAVHDYEELAARHAHLTAQHADLVQAGKTLRLAIADLEEAMKRQFNKTFALIAAEFRRCFTTLFGGGAARLVLTQPDNLAETGIEIVAQPPGKRMQNLALLSGGERALTAVALLFAILRIKPAPFCVLDEIDAALDDSNVGRIADMLSQLKSETQFVVITHNRGTMQAADTLYGVSIGAEGVSRLMSLRLDDIPVESE